MKPDLSFLHVSALTVLGIAAIVGFYAGGFARRFRVPALIGYMIVGVILGPSILRLLGDSTMAHVSFITEIALGFVAFSIGSELRLQSLKQLGPGMIAVILGESFGAFLAVFGAVYLLTHDLSLAIIFGAVAPASAPAGTVAVIQECKAKGSLTQALYAVVGFDDGLAIVIFAFAATAAKTLVIGGASETTGSILSAMLTPAKEIAFSLVLGSVIGLVFCQMVRRLHSARDIFIIVFGAVLIATGLSIRWHLSLILTNMMVGFVLVNTRRESLVHHVKAPLLDVMPLLFVLFFFLAGAHLELSALPKVGVLGGMYILGRSAGKFAGVRAGCMFGALEDKIKKYIGLGILSQAGVAIGLSLIVKQEFDQLAIQHDLPHLAVMGTTVLTTITASCIFFEIIGPILTKIALGKAGEIPAGKTDQESQSP